MKVLIFFNKNDLKPIGGPAGYLYNLSLNLSDEYDFLESSYVSKTSNIKSKLPPKIRIFLSDISRRIKTIKILYTFDKRIKNIDVNQYDAIHFHKTSDLYRCRKKLKNYKGKVILTSHCPKVSYLETCEDFISKFEYNTHKFLYNRLEKVDIYAFMRADKIIFPCKEAEEPYYHTWPWYLKNDNFLGPKKEYVITGILQKKVTMAKEVLRKKINIPKNAFVCCYVGRHTEVKGYPIFLKLWDYFKDDENVYFLCCGNLGNYKTPDNHRWIEIGWTSNSQDYINCSDVFILPNKETYFDLVFLEVLSIGTPIIASKTGGNKYFEKYKGTGINLYNNEERLVKEIYYLKKNKEKIAEYRRNNNKLFIERFNENEFSRNYMKTISDIINK